MLSGRRVGILEQLGDVDLQNLRNGLKVAPFRYSRSALPVAHRPLAHAGAIGQILLRNSARVTCGSNVRAEYVRVDAHLKGERRQLLWQSAGILVVHKVPSGGRNYSGNMEEQQMPLHEDRFAEVLAEIQKERGLDDAGLAELCEIGIRQLNNWRAGRQRPHWNKAVRLARKVGMEPKDFMGLEATA